mmetsp:Transcript_25662/g.53455  ORF Transcript_25662/g.53455 Transcript_25662/m.53455 type:complete len:234 (-) Transcript_25662:83-784(-)
MRDGIQIGGNELGIVFINGQLCVLNLVVVDVTIKSDNDGTDILINFQTASRTHIGLFAFIVRSTNVRHTNQIQFLTNANFSNDIGLFTRFLKFGLFQIRGGGKTGRKDFFGRDTVQTQPIKLFLVTRTRFGGIVGDKKTFFARLSQFFQGFGNARNQRIAPPNDTIAIKNENIHLIQQFRLGIGQFQHIGVKGAGCGQGSTSHGGCSKRRKGLGASQQQRRRKSSESEFHIDG